MSRLALPSSKKPGKFAFFGQQRQQSENQGRYSALGLSTGGSGGGSRGGAAAARAALSDDSWDLSDDEEERKHHNVQQNAATQDSQQQAQQVPGPAVAATQPLPALQPAPLFATPRSEVYDIDSSSDSDSDSDCGSRQPRAASSGPAAGDSRRSHAQEAAPEDGAHRSWQGVQPPPSAGPAAVAAPNRRQQGPAVPAQCLICGSSLVHLSWEQQQQHVNAVCCDAAAAHPSKTQQRHQQQQQDSIPAYRPCHQQQQQPPAQQQQQLLARAQPPKEPQLQPRQESNAPAPAKTALQVQHKDQQEVSTQVSEQQATRHCHLCGTDLSRLHYLQQVSHVKACMAGRGTRPAQQQQQQQQTKQQQQGKQRLPAGSGKALVPQATTSGAAPHARSAPASGPSGSGPPAATPGLGQMTIRQWLEGLGLGCYSGAFEAEEVEVGVVHLITAQELAGLGVADRLHQTRILRAAQEAAAALCLRQPRTLGNGSGAAGKDGRAGGSKKQQQLKELLASGPGSNAAAAAKPTLWQQHAQPRQQPQQPQQQHFAAGGPDEWNRQRQQYVQQASSDSSMREAGPRPQERALLDSFYPKQLTGAPSSHQQQQQQQQQQLPRRTPQLPAGRTASRAAPPAVSLWAGAAACAPVGPTLAARLAQKEAEDPSQAASRQQPLARGGTAYPVAQESRALKRVKLEALREELRQHEATVAELRRMIEGLEREVEGG